MKQTAIREVSKQQLDAGYHTLTDGLIIMRHAYTLIAKLGENRYLVEVPQAKRLSR